MSQYLGVFLDEAQEQLGLLESEILRMERGEHGADVLNTLFRAAHTLKGSSRAMGFLAIGDLTHEMENVLDDLRGDKMAVDTPVVDALLRCLDALGVLIETVSGTGQDTGAPNESDIPGLVAHLRALREGGGAPAVAAASAAAPSAEPAPATPNAPVAVVAASDLALPEHVRLGCDEARAAGLGVFRVDVALRADCVMKSVRVFMTLGALEPLGTVLFSQPDQDALEAEAFDQSFTLLLASDRDEAVIKAALGSISELDRADVTAFGVASEAGKEGAAGLPGEAVKEGEAVLAPTVLATQAPPVSSEGVVDTAAAVPARPDSPGKPAAPAGAAPPAKAAPAAAPPPPPQTATIRVDVARLDNLLNLIGELVIDRTQIARVAGELHQAYPQDERASHLIETTHRVARITGELQDEIMKARMLPIDGVFQRLPRMVRDLAQKTGKDVDFQMAGGETELDRSVLESLGDPLIHLLRNAVDHGVEPADERTGAGKPRRGAVRLAARHEENHIVIEITDDGRGIDPIKIKAAAVKKNVITPAAADAMTDRDAIGLIFAPGFSTAATLSDISGRGVGMDIVKANLEKLGGRVSVDSAVGVGSRFTIHLPLTLAIARALLIASGGGTYVIPLGTVIEMLRLGEDGDGDTTMRVAHGRAVMVLRGKTVPLADLADVLDGDLRSATDPERIGKEAYVVVVGVGDKQIGLCVDGLVGEQDVVIKSLGRLLGDLPGLSGATILGDGRVALIVDVAKAVDTLQGSGAAALTSVAA